MRGMADLVREREGLAECLESQASSKLALPAEAMPLQWRRVGRVVPTRRRGAARRGLGGKPPHRGGTWFQP